MLPYKVLIYEPRVQLNNALCRIRPYFDKHGQCLVVTDSLDFCKEAMTSLRPWRYKLLILSKDVFSYSDLPDIMHRTYDELQLHGLKTGLMELADVIFSATMSTLIKSESMDIA